jgi:hypothetical protein
MDERAPVPLLASGHFQYGTLVAAKRNLAMKRSGYEKQKAAVVV